MRDFNQYIDNLGRENKEHIMTVRAGTSGLSFRRPDPNSATLFDPNLLAAFKQAVMDYIRHIDGEDPLLEFDERCPPGGRESIVLYTTSLRGIRKTFEDCSSVKLLLESLKLVFVERDVSMHVAFRDELWRLLGFRAMPPRLFVKGRYIGGADEVLGLHERGKLLLLVRGMPRSSSVGGPCQGCRGMRFAVCAECNGGRKVFADEKAVCVMCLKCNENGMVVCPLCC